MLLFLGKSNAEITRVKANFSDTQYLKIHFLYGSKPKRKFKKIEKKWFGGKMGGHVGIEADSEQILNFCRKGKLHIFQHDKDRHSCFKLSTTKKFNTIFDSTADSVKTLTVYVPVTALQKSEFDKIKTQYLLNAPYDYAFMGMRCGAAAYEILAQIGVVKRMSYHRTWHRIFYPKRLRKRMIKMAAKNHWKTSYTTGTYKRKWEKD